MLSPSGDMLLYYVDDNLGGKICVSEIVFSPAGDWVMIVTPQGPKLVSVTNGVFAHDSSLAFLPLKDLNHIRWIEG